MNRRMTSAVAAMALLVATAGASAPAHADNLLDMLFGGGIKKARRAEFPPPPPAERRVKPRKVAAEAAKISAPQYVAYKPDRLVKVDFSPLTDVVTTAALNPSASAPDFASALGGLADYQLETIPEIARALVDHYAKSRAFIWVDAGGVSAKASAAMGVLADAAAQGLDPAEYRVDIPASSDPFTTIRFEMALSAQILRFVRDAETGVVDPNRMSGYYDLPRRAVDLAAVLRDLSEAADAGAYLGSRQPRMPEYSALRAELADLAASGEQSVSVDPKLLLKPGQSSPELPKLLDVIAAGLDDELGGEFGELLWQLRGAETYQPELVPLFKALQARAGLKTDGIVGPRSVAAIVGVSKEDRIRKVRLAMEALRWLPSTLGSPRVFINQPAFTASYIDDTRPPLTMRVVVGAPSTQTTFFYDEIEQVDYNPYWGVPQSIIVNEMLPRLRRDPGYLDRAGYEVTDARGKVIPSSAVDWGQFGTKVPFNVRQSPSEANALGELKILFPNNHAIYMHDTPSKSFFQRDSRALSHGCIRLQDPRGMAAAVLGTSLDHVAAKLKQGHSSEKVQRKIPVYVAYFTAWPDETGKVAYFDDVYGRDERLAQALAATAAARGAGT
ncbi:MAG: L,D-transpeptidase family protein [Rhizobiaceae bacterium]|nr:L,D-transpeptidase family protein [Rhizobiaceae bacterium]